LSSRLLAEASLVKAAEQAAKTAQETAQRLRAEFEKNWNAILGVIRGT
jgi:hypothetical protein